MSSMRNTHATRIKNKQFPVIVEKDADGFYTVECTLLSGCFTQGKTLDEALGNIKEVIALCLEEKENRDIARTHDPKEVSLHTITV